MLIVVAMVALSTACPEASAFVAGLAKQPAVACKFEQRKRSPLFRKELRSQGQLWVRGGKEPKLRFDSAKASLVVNGGEIVMKQGAKTERMALSGLPRVEAFLATFPGLFVGELGGLGQSFAIAAECDGDRTTLRLTPKQPEQSVVRRLVLAFDGKRLVKVALVEPSDDEIDLALSDCRFAADAVPDAVFGGQ